MYFFIVPCLYWRLISSSDIVLNPKNLVAMRLRQLSGARADDKWPFQLAQLGQGNIYDHTKAFLPSMDVNKRIYQVYWWTFEGASFSPILCPIDFYYFFKNFMRILHEGLPWNFVKTCKCVNFRNRIFSDQTEEWISRINFPKIISLSESISFLESPESQKSWSIGFDMSFFVVFVPPIQLTNLWKIRNSIELYKPKSLQDQDVQFRNIFWPMFA